MALAGNYSAVYPRRSPGGWQLIGRTNAKMWDLDREPPALAAPGHRVQFRPVRDALALAAEPVAEPAVEPAAAPAAEGTAPEPVAGQDVTAGIRIVSPGLQSLIQDLGRDGHSGLGVSAAGALDRASLRRANRLVGNAPGAAGIETVAGGLKVQAVGDQVLAVTGAPSELSIASAPDDAGDTWQRTVPMATPFALLDGETLSIGAPQSGFRSYLAVRGGVDAAPVLGSRSTDTMSGIGPAPAGRRPAPGRRRRGRDRRRRKSRTAAGLPGHRGHRPRRRPRPPRRLVRPGGTGLLHRPGLGRAAAVQPRRHAAGGYAAAAHPPGRTASEGTVAGALQVPPEGLPVLFLADHPITGGYPVIAVVVDSQLDLAAQVPIGGRIRFRWAESATTEHPTEHGTN